MPVPPQDTSPPQLGNNDRWTGPDSPSTKPNTPRTIAPVYLCDSQTMGPLVERYAADNGLEPMLRFSGFHQHPKLPGGGYDQTRIDQDRFISAVRDIANNDSHLLIDVEGSGPGTIGEAWRSPTNSRAFEFWMKQLRGMRIAHDDYRSAPLSSYPDGPRGNVDSIPDSEQKLRIFCDRFRPAALLVSCYRHISTAFDDEANYHRIALKVRIAKRVGDDFDTPVFAVMSDFFCKGAFDGWLGHEASLIGDAQAARNSGASAFVLFRLRDKQWDDDPGAATDLDKYELTLCQILRGIAG